MGLDMYLHGRKYCNHSNELKADGFKVSSINLELGYWRKHPNLHGYIVESFADGEDNCQPIHLEEDDIRQIIDAIKAETLPDTEGFFFGESTGSDEEKAPDLAIFEAALSWLETPDTDHLRDISYHASW